MTVAIQDTRFIHTGNGITTEFGYECVVTTSEDMKVYVDGEEITTGFTVTGIGTASGGTVVFDTAPADGAEIILRRVVALERDTNYPQNGDFEASVVNQDFDRVWHAFQQQQDELTRTMKMPLNVLAADFDPTLPDGIAGVPNAALITNPTGTGFTAGPTADQISSAQTYATQASESKTAAQEAQRLAEDARDAAQEAAASIDPATLVRNTGDESIGGVKTFTSPIVANITGNAATADQADTATSATTATTADKLSTASGSAPSYAARAWVNFNGTGTVAIRASGNVSSITDNGTGDYAVNFTTAMPDANYAANTTWGKNDSTDAWGVTGHYSLTGSAYRFKTRDLAGSAYDPPTVTVSIFR